MAKKKNTVAEIFEKMTDDELKVLEHNLEQIAEYEKEKLLPAVFTRWSKARDEKEMEMISTPAEFATMYETLGFYPASVYYFGELTLIREVGYNDVTGKVVCFNGIDRIPGG